MRGEVNFRQSNIPYVFLILTLILVLSPASAQDSSSEPVTITITPTRVEKNIEDIPAAVSIVGQEKIQLGTEQLGLDESLGQIPGLFFFNRYNFAQDLRASIRGFGSRSNFGIRGIKIIVDGIPETLADGQGSVDGIDIGSARQISVIRGPASALYGNASGGAILIETEQATGVPFAEFRLTAGDYDFTKAQVKLGGGGSGKLNYLLNVSDTSIDGYRDHNEFENTQFNGRFDYRLSDASSLMTTIHHTDQPLANDPGGINAVDAMANPEQARDRNVLLDAGEDMQQTRIGLLYKTELNDDENLEARFYNSARDFEGRLPVASSGIIIFDRTFNGGGLKYTLKNNLAGKPNRLLLGIDYDRQDDERTRFDNVQGAIGAQTLNQTELVTSIGTYIQNETRLSEDLELTLGLRYDHIEFDVSDDFLSDGDDSGKVNLDHLSPMIGLSFRKNKNTRYYATLSNAFETPTTIEFANPSGGGFNQNLEPQESTNYEIGIKTNSERYSFEVALFHIDIDDELTPFELNGRTFFENAGSSSRDGLEVAYSRKLTRQFELATSYTYSDFVFDRFTDAIGNIYDGNTLPGIPEDLLHIGLSWKGENGFYAKLNNTYTGALYADNANTTAVKSHVVSDLRLGYTGFRKDWEFETFMGVNNLFDEDYNSNIRINAFGGRYFEPAPERNLFAGFTLRKKIPI
jgi:iron complex outermembrane receptor protein